uniref:SGNH hydrolase-type esterase domain-containing protein n=1 Tax=Xenopus tropicalis TaxID=8364 RepID=A0A803JI24_XENTR
MSCSMIAGVTQCASCRMYVVLEQQFHAAFTCERCRWVFLLESEVQNLRGELAALRAAANMGENRRLTEQPLAGAGVVGGGEGTVEVNEGDKFVTVKRGSRGHKGRGAGSQLVQSNRFAALGEDAGEDSSELACMERADSQSTLGAGTSNTGGGSSARKGRQAIVVGDSIIRKVDRVICHKDPTCRTVCCLPGARVRHVVERVDKLLGGAGEDPAVLVHIGTNDKVRGGGEVLKNDFKKLGAKLRARTSKVIFSEILPVPRATLRRQRELREINAWLRDWCREEGFGFLQNWADFSIGYRLFARDGGHLNDDGAAALGEKMA